MPDPAGTFQDGGVVYGSYRVTLKNVDDVNEEYVLKNFSVDEPVNDLVRKNEVGVPDGQVFIADRVTGSATGQFSTSTSKLPKKFQPFALPDEGGGSTIYFIKSVSRARGQDAEATFTIQFTKRLAPES